MFKMHKALVPILFLGLFLVAGCKPHNAAPAPLAVEKIPGAMRNSFAQAGPDTKQAVEKMLAALQETNYPAAYQAGQAVSASPGITSKQMLLTQQALLTINELLKQASAQGNQDASAFISYQRHNR